MYDNRILKNNDTLKDKDVFEDGEFYTVFELNVDDHEALLAPEAALLQKFFAISRIQAFLTSWW